MAGAGVDSVVLVEEWVYRDLQAGFTESDQAEILDDIDEMEENLTVWNRDLGNCVDILTDVASETVYRRRQGSFRTYFVRRSDTLYCIGVGERDTTYERDMDTVAARADAWDPSDPPF